MARNRVAYLLILLSVLIFSVLYQAWFSFYALIVVLLLPPLDLLISLPGMLARRGTLAVPPMLEQGERGLVQLSVPARRRLPTGGIKGRITVTRAGKTARRRVRFFGTTGTQAIAPSDTAHSGVIIFTLKRLWATSLLGFFSLPLPVKRRASALVLPAPVPPLRPPVLPKSEPLRPKPGGGYAEEHDIRPYRPGDPLNSMHWKLSAKYDAPMIREPLERPLRNRLILCADWTAVHEQDLILGRLRWLSTLLLTRGYPHFVRLGVNGPTAALRQEEDLVAFLRHALGSEPAAAPALPPHFTSVYRIDAKEAL